MASKRAWHDEGSLTFSPFEFIFTWKLLLFYPRCIIGDKQFPTPGNPISHRDSQGWASASGPRQTRPLTILLHSRLSHARSLASSTLMYLPYTAGFTSFSYPRRGFPLSIRLLTSVFIAISLNSLHPSSPCVKTTSRSVNLLCPLTFSPSPF